MIDYFTWKSWLYVPKCPSILLKTPSEPIPVLVPRTFSGGPEPGGIYRLRKPEAASEGAADSERDSLVPYDQGEPEASPEAMEKPADKVILRNPKWEVETVGFNEETEISVEAELPESQAHKTKVESGNLLNKVKYFFTAKHSASDLLKADTAFKVVDQMAIRLFESHILEDITFATGKSQIRASQAEALKTLVDRIRAWKTRHPDGKLAVFGHADAEGREEPNKRLSERRARAVQAFLVKDASVWDALAKEEKWDRTSEPEPKAFMAEHNTLSLMGKDFDSIDGMPYAGCSEFNLVEEAPGANERNRRVAIFQLKSNRNFPIQYPCKLGDIEACRKQKARKGQRRTAGFGCCFYDGLVQETPGGDSTGVGGATGGKVLEVFFENEAGEKIEVTRAGRSVRLVLRSENLVGKSIVIDLSDVTFDIEYQGKLLDKGILEAVEVTGDLQRIGFVPRKRGEKTRGGGRNG